MLPFSFEWVWDTVHLVFHGGLVRSDMFRDVPRLTMGHDYLLFTTKPSSIGLSTAVGLGQGAFAVYSQDKQDWAVNEFDNTGLGMGGSGAVAYVDLVAAIKAEMGE